MGRPDQPSEFATFFMLRARPDRSFISGLSVDPNRGGVRLVARLVMGSDRKFSSWDNNPQTHNKAATV